MYEMNWAGSSWKARAVLTSGDVNEDEMLFNMLWWSKHTHKQDIKDLFTVSLPPLPPQVGLAYTHAAAAFSLLLAQTLSKWTCVH